MKNFHNLPFFWIILAREKLGNPYLHLIKHQNENYGNKIKKISEAEFSLCCS